MVRPDAYSIRLREIYETATQLPPQPCAVLLFSLRDKLGDSLLHPLPALGIATATQIARATGLREADVVYLWDKLPADEATIARALGLPRHEVLRLMGATHRWLQQQLRQGRHTASSAASTPIEHRAA